MQKNVNMEEILNKYSDMVYRIALARCQNRENAEDVFQDVFIKYSEKLPRFENEEHEKAWFIRVTINMTKNILKLSWNTKIEELDENLAFETKEEYDVYSAVNKLPKNYKTVIYLMYFEGYKVKEISELMDTNENTIKTWLSRAREMLKDELKGGFEDE